MSLSYITNKRSGIIHFLATIMALLSLFTMSVQAKSAVEKRNQRIEALINHFMAQAQVPGASVLVARKGKVIFQKSYGLANIEQNIVVDSDTAFPVGSITKQFTGLAIAQLITAGQLSLDDPLHKFLPDYPAQGKNITIRNLLNHTSGLTNYTIKKELHARAWKKHSHEEMMAWFQDEPLVFEPGTRWNYTNSGIYLLGVIIEKISGLSYAEYIQKNIFTPFDMTRSYVAGSKEIIPRRAAGYDLTGEGYKNARSYDFTVPFSAGAIISTTGDLLKYLNIVHRSDRISREIKNIIYKQEVLPDGHTLDYTLGCLFVGDLNGRKVYTHAGEVYGFFADSAYYPADDLTIIIFTNRMDYLPNPPHLSRKIAREVLDLEQPQYTPQTITAADKAQLTGSYHYLSESFFQYDMATVSFSGDKLILRTGPTKERMYAIPFYYAGKGQYLMVVDDEITLKVTSIDEGNVLLFQQGAIQYRLKKIKN